MLPFTHAFSPGNSYPMSKHTGETQVEPGHRPRQRPGRSGRPAPAGVRPRPGRTVTGADDWQRTLNHAVEALRDPGWGVIDGFLPDSLWRGLAQLARDGFERGDFHPAGIGEGAAVTTGVRGDAIRWLYPQAAQGAERAFWERIEQLRLAINRNLWLGLMEYECHYARYPEGAFYQRHLDRLRDRPERTVTLITYLNEGWTEADGGALRIFPQGSEPVEIPPLGGRAVIFLSEELEHEVLPARRPRLALTGWFRRRAYQGRLV